MVRKRRAMVLAILAGVVLGFSVLTLYEGFSVLAKNNRAVQENLANLIQLELASVLLLDTISSGEFEEGIQSFQERHMPSITALLDKPHHSTSKKIVEDFLGSVTMNGNLSLDQTSRIISILKTRETTSLTESVVAVAISANQIVTFSLVGILVSFVILVFSLIVFLFDAKKNKKLEDDLLEAKETLEYKVQERTKELELANSEKTKFLATISHELRTPLFAITGLAEELAANINSEEKHLVLDIQQSGKQLLTIINQILNFTAYDKNRPAVIDRHTHLLPLLLEYTKTEPRVEVFVAEELQKPILIDTEKIKQILDQLISNALKFSQTNIRLEASVTNASLLIDVSDKGSGIPQEKLEEMFIPFKQGPRAGSGGVGLGLTICRHVAENLEGQLEVFSGKTGTKVRISLPLKWADIIENTSHPIERYKILIAEDTELNRKVLAMLLKRLGQETHFAENGEQAYEMVKKEKFDVILMDIEMPILDGFEATKKIRMLPEYKYLPIIAVTAHSVTAILDKAKKCGMNDWLTKPVGKADLEKLLQSLPKT